MRRLAKRRLTLLLFVLGLALHHPSAAAAQEPDAPDGATIDSVEVAGLALDRLSPGLRQDIDALRGTPLDRARTSALATRIEQERPEVVAAVRAIARPDGTARVVFLVAPISDDVDLVENINARYDVERVEITGVSERRVSQELRDRMQALVGFRLDTREADWLVERLKLEFPDHEVTRRIVRGSARGRIRVVFDILPIDVPWIRFAPSRAKLVYHADQKWTGVVDLAVSRRNHRAGVGVVFANKDDLIEEYSGFRLHLESRKLGTPRVGAGMELARYNQTWQDVTLAALAADADIPAAYRTRLTVEPTVTFAVNPHLRVFGGVSISELQSLSAAPATQMAAAWVAGVGADRRWPHEGGHQRLEGRYALRSATTGLGSDLVYRRHVAEARYRVEHRRSALLASTAVGYATGQAPLFERFSLGDSSTLRGWNKFDLAPAGGTRMFHQSLEYRYRAIALFVDTGSVWDATRDRRVRLSTGFGLHGDNGFVTVGFPLDADGAGATFMIGVRF